jgi:hypothetical protein
MVASLVPTAARECHAAQRSSLALFAAYKGMSPAYYLPPTCYDTDKFREAGTGLGAARLTTLQQDE